MKRKKWSEQEEETLLTKYSELVSSGALSKLKTREKKFKPIAEHVTALHHGTDPSSFPFRWSWRDVSVKVQNMRHQYLGVKQKIRLSDHRFDWPDGVNHWHNFLRYKHVFGDLDLPAGDAAAGGVSDSESEAEIYAARREREERREREGEEREARREREGEERERRRERAEEEREEREFAAEERVWEVFERRRRREVEAVEERRRWRRVEERREEEEMEWRERMVEEQMEYERRVMRAHAEACQAQMQALGAVARLACQLLGGGGDGDGDGLGSMAMQNLHHPGAGELGESAKPDSNSLSEFM